MLSLQQCLDHGELTPDEVSIIAEHQNVPEIIAVEIGQMLVQTSSGVGLLKRYMCENIAHVRTRKKFEKVRHLEAVYRGFEQKYPHASA